VPRHFSALRSEIFVEFVAKNPLFDPKSSEALTIPLFDEKLEAYLQSLPCFKS
jgi:hypothetical protein